MKYSLLRGTQQPIPENMDRYLSDLQKLGLCQAEEYGWHVEFVRRSDSRNALTVLLDGEDRRWGTLQKDGCIGIGINVPVRH